MKIVLLAMLIVAFGSSPNDAGKRYELRSCL